MADDSTEFDYEGYETQKFKKVAQRLFQDSDKAITQAKKNISKLKGSKARFSGGDISDYSSDISLLIKSRRAFMSDMGYVVGEHKIDVAVIDKHYDEYCLSLAQLRVINERYDAILGSKIISSFMAALQVMLVLRKVIAGDFKKMENAIKKLEKILKKAEKEKWKTYIKVGLDYAWDAAKILSPHLRGLSLLSTFALDSAVSLSTTILLGKDSDYLGDAIGITRAGAELEYAARGLDSGAKALKASGKAMKIAGRIDGIKSIRSARKAVAELEAAIKSVQGRIEWGRDYLKKTAKDVNRAKLEYRKSMKRLRAQEARIRDAEAYFHKFQAIRNRL